MSGCPSYYRRSLVQPGSRVGTAENQEAPAWPDLNKKKKNYDNILLKVLFLPMACYSNSFYFRSLCFGAFNFVPVVVLKELRLVGLAKGLLLSFEGWKGSVCPRSWT